MDVWDALTSDRPYRSAWAEDKVHEHIRISSGTQFDPDVMDAFLLMPK
jgi:HD-GYP domain-containing protein (c-di-GMP phosphodiesterase class II)